MSKKIYVDKQEIAQKVAVDQQYQSLLTTVAKDSDSKAILSKLGEITTKIAKLSPSPSQGSIVTISEAEYNKLPANKKNDANIVYKVY